MLCARAGFPVVPFPVVPFPAVPFPADVRVSAGRACTLLDLLPDAHTLRQTALALREWYGFLLYQLVER